MEGLNTKKLYQECEDFKNYVDKYSRDRRITIEEGLQHKLVYEAGKYYKYQLDNVLKEDVL